MSRVGDTAGGESDAEGTLQLPARSIPVPQSLSAAARQFLLAGAARMPMARAAVLPPVTDKAAWKRHVAAADQMFEPMIERLLASAATVARKSVGGANACIGTPRVMRHPDRARLTIHGGGWVLLGGRYVMGDAAQAAAEGGCVAFSVDYRMPPDFPFPAALDDCLAVYREIIKTYDPRKVAISGASAGGNIAAALVLKIRDLGLPLPGAVGMMTPATDLAELGDSWQANRGVDVVLARPALEGIALYADGHDLRDPYLSPLYGDFTRGFAPTFLQSGTRDRLLSDTVRMHRALVRARVPTELHVWEGMPHGGFGGESLEDLEIRAQFLEFLDKHLPA